MVMTAPHGALLPVTPTRPDDAPRGQKVQPVRRELSLFCRVLWSCCVHFFELLTQSTLTKDKRGWSCTHQKISLVLPIPNPWNQSLTAAGSCSRLSLLFNAHVFGGILSPRRWCGVAPGSLYGAPCSTNRFPTSLPFWSKKCAWTPG